MMKMYYEWRSLSVGKVGKCRKMQLKFPNLSFPSFFFFQNQPVSLIGVFAWHILLYIDHPCVGITVNVK